MDGANERVGRESPGEWIEARYLVRRQLVPTIMLAGFAAYFVVLWSLDHSSLWLLLGVLEFAAFAVLGVTVVVRMRRSGWVLRLDPTGVTVRGAEQVPWSDLRQVVLGPLKPFPSFTTTRWTQVLAFVPRDGVELPGPPHFRGRPQRWGASIRRRFYGTNLTMLPHAMSVTADELVDAAREWGGLDVRRSRRLPPVVAVLLGIVIVAVLGALVAPLLSLL